MRQEHKEEAAVLIRRMAQTLKTGGWQAFWWNEPDWQSQLTELVETVARTLPEAR